VIVAPSVTFRQDLRLDLGGVSVELDYPGPTHTAGSIIARIREDDVLFSGDMLFTNYHVTMIDGDVANWCQVLRTLQSTAPRTIIPGHGPISSVADLQAMEEYLRVFDEEATRLLPARPPPTPTPSRKNFRSGCQVRRAPNSLSSSRPTCA